MLRSARPAAVVRAARAPAPRRRQSAAAAFETRRVAGRGRGLYAVRPLPAGLRVVEACAPLVAVADAASAPLACAVCLRAAGAFLPGGQACAGGCGAVYCSAACARAAAAGGAHALLCGSTAALDAWCAARGANFPRAAAAMLATSLEGGGARFGEYWTAVNGLVAHPVPADAADLPAVWREGYALVVAALSKKMDAPGAQAFFSTAFDLRTYARLMGTLRLNSFALEVPLGSRAPAAARAPPPLPPAAAAAPAAEACTASGGVAAACADGGAAAAGCCAGGEGDESGAAVAAERSGGTAMYPAPVSLVNHSCEPSLDVLIGPEGYLALTTRRAVDAGEELTISYLDSSMPVHARRGKLLHGYGFECECALCTAQLAQDRAARAVAARSARAAEEAQRAPFN